MPSEMGIELRREKTRNGDSHKIRDSGSGREERKEVRGRHGNKHNLLYAEYREGHRAGKSGSRKRERQRDRVWCCLSPDKRAGLLSRLQRKEGMKRDLGANTGVDIHDRPHVVYS